MFRVFKNAVGRYEVQKKFLWWWIPYNLVLDRGVDGLLVRAIETHGDVLDVLRNGSYTGVVDAIFVPYDKHYSELGEYRSAQDFRDQHVEEFI